MIYTVISFQMMSHTQTVDPSLKNKTPTIFALLCLIEEMLE